MAQGKGDGVRLGVGRLEWALHPRPAGALTRCPVAASPARGPSGRLADPGLLVGCRSSGDARAGTTTTTTVHWGREWGGAAASARPLIISVPHGSEASGWPSAAPAGGDRPRRWAPEAVRAGSRGTPQTATRGTQPGAPGRARGGPASPARPPAEAGWRRLGAPAGVPPRQDPWGGGGVGILLRAIGGGLTLELGGRRERKLPCDGPSRAPGKAPGRLTIERPSDRRSPGRNPGPQGAFEERREEGGAARPPTARRDGPAPRQASPLGSQPPRFQERFQALGPGASPPTTRARGAFPGAARGPGSPAAAGPSRRTGRSRASLRNPRPGRRARVPGNEGGVSAPPARRPSARRGRESPVPRRAAPSRASRPGLAHPPALVGRSRGSLAGPGSSSPRPPCRPGTAGLSGVVQAQGGTTIRFTLPGSCRVGVGSVSGGA
ncbi:hypothetical protein NDU88_000791 [Pleurodeles waltl]|uniref:Uncharacterized protein n=1 Tax=Pleurodeles waltl TaxID=8319 RepID=A0AAV7U607_PLEWA|nr:hypothetical protein NDU88_000781 [Pleurodeles waltl]KAJ1183981.1 hypothetical protein NDU88_000791 [Pleurodeles waltl]